MLSSRDITLYLMQAVGSDPSAHPDLISSTMLSMGVPFQKAGFEGCATALPKRARAIRQTTLADVIVLLVLACLAHWTTAGEIVMVTRSYRRFLYSYFEFSA